MQSKALTLRDMRQRYQEALRLERAWEENYLGVYTARPYVTSYRRQTGSFYTPLHIVQLLTGYTLDPILAQSRQQAASLRVMDPACGGGRFLLCAFRRMFLFHLRVMRREPDCIAAAAARALAALAGRDISEDALDCARHVLKIASGLPEPSIDLQQSDTTTTGFAADVVLGNPPWGANGIDAATAAATGLPASNSNTFSVIVSRAWHGVPPGGRVGFVLPRNFLKGYDYAPVRRMLLDTGQLEWVIDAVRPFPGVTQEAVLVIARKLHSGEQIRPVRAARLTMSSRHKPLLQDEHQVDQGDIAAGPSALIAIHAAPAVRDVLKQMETASIRLRAMVTWQRGLEYGHNGLLVRCQACGNYTSAPTKKIAAKACPSCGRPIQRVAQPDYNLIAKTADAAHTHPIYAGRQVGRYQLAPAYWLDRNVPGVRYKTPAMFAEPKVLLPKIAPGIAATCDNTGAYVTQGVYFLRPAAAWDLRMLLGWLNSSAVAFYYEHRFNDQAQLTTNLVLAHLLSLPVPDITNITVWRKIADGAAVLTQLYGRREDDEMDAGAASMASAAAEAAVDQAVVELYGLDEETARIIADWRGRVPIFRAAKAL